MRVASYVGPVVWALTSLSLRTTETVYTLTTLVNFVLIVLVTVLTWRHANRLRDFLDTGDARQYLAALVTQRWFLRAQVAAMVCSFISSFIDGIVPSF